MELQRGGTLSFAILSLADAATLVVIARIAPIPRGQSNVSGNAVNITARRMSPVEIAPDDNRVRPGPLEFRYPTMKLASLEFLAAEVMGSKNRARALSIKAPAANYSRIIWPNYAVLSLLSRHRSLRSFENCKIFDTLYRRWIMYRLCVG